MSRPQRRRALLIGTEHHQDPTWARLPCTRADTERLAEVLRDRTVGGFEVTVLSDLGAEAMREAIERFCVSCEPDDLALIYISGHGARSPEGEFVFVATDTLAAEDALHNSGMSAGTLNDMLQDRCFAGTRVAMFDTCESGAFTLGFETRVAKSLQQRVPSEPVPPITPSGVYVLASSDMGQNSYAGDGGTPEDPVPSVFTGEIVEVLKAGAASASASGLVSVEDLFDTVALRLRSTRQRPVRSSIRVTGRIEIAARPLGAARRGVVPTRSGATAVAPESAPDLATLIAYYADVVRAESDSAPLLPVRGGDYALVTGEERALRGAFDEDGCIPVPPGAERLVARSGSEHQLWAGWPAVVVHTDGPLGSRYATPHVAPLLMRRLDVVRAESGVRLRPEGEIVPHPGLAHTWLGPEEAENLARTYRPTWHRQESGRMAEDVGQLLRDPFELPTVQPLLPEQLAGDIDVATAGDGARNAAMLITTTVHDVNKSLLDELTWTRSNPTRIPSTALAALYPEAEEPPAIDCPELVTPLALNPAQRRVLESAMTRRLTVATGPPGTGKSQLVVNAVAAAVAAGERVLVASSNNQAVDEVHGRCEQLVRGMLVRTGNEPSVKKARTALGSLLRTDPPDRAENDSRQAFRQARRRYSTVAAEFGEVGAGEAARARVEQELTRTVASLGVGLGKLDEHLGPGWPDRVAALIEARWFGVWRRRRFLGSIAGSTPADDLDTCRTLTHLVRMLRISSESRESTDTQIADDELRRRQRDATDGVREEAVGYLTAGVRRRAADGSGPVSRLHKVLRDKNRHEFRAAWDHLPAWAVTTRTAGRVPLDPGRIDLVVIDEASQCSIASVLPLLLRARRVLIIGDPMQLPHISGISERTDEQIRTRHGIDQDWIGANRLSPVRHSAFDAAARAVGEPLLLNEHYRCAPAIAALANKLFYHRRLEVLTESATPHRSRVAGPAIEWRHASGIVSRGPGGRSWLNETEIDAVAKICAELDASLPEDATIGVVTPFRPHADELSIRLADTGRPVVTGTAHRFQGGERDVMVFSLVGGQGMPDRTVDWFDQQQELWNVAITRARSRLIVVGDAELWEQRSVIARHLLRAARASEAVGSEPLDDEMADRLYDAVAEAGRRSGREWTVATGETVNGYRCETVTDADGWSRPIVLDRGHDAGVDPGEHLDLVLRRTALLADDAVRLPAWLLDSPDDLADRLARSEEQRCGDDAGLPEEARSDHTVTTDAARGS